MANSRIYKLSSLVKKYKFIAFEKVLIILVLIMI